MQRAQWIDSPLGSAYTVRNMRIFLPWARTDTITRHHCLKIRQGTFFTHAFQTRLPLILYQVASAGEQFHLPFDQGTQALSLTPSHHNHSIGQQIGIRLATGHVITFNPQLGE